MGRSYLNTETTAADLSTAVIFTIHSEKRYTDSAPSSDCNANISNLSNCIKKEH